MKGWWPGSNGSVLVTLGYLGILVASCYVLSQAKLVTQLYCQVQTAKRQYLLRKRNSYSNTLQEGGVVGSVAGYARLGGLLYSVHKYSITAFVILSLNSLMTLQAIPCAYVQIVQYTHNLL